MTLLERFDEVPVHKWPTTVSIDKIRRALAIAQAVEERKSVSMISYDGIIERADELLEEGS